MEDFTYFADGLRLGPVAEEMLSHYGVGHQNGGHSGRYPWGSGKMPFQHRDEFMAYVGKLQREGKLEKDIADEIGISTTTLRIQMMIAKHEYRQQLVEKNQAMIDQGISRAERARILGMNESSLRSLENEATAANKNTAFLVADKLKEVVGEKKMIDVGAKVEKEISVGNDIEREMGVSRNKLNEALYILQREGYNVYGVGLKTGEGKQTITQVLADKDISYEYAYKHPGEIESFREYHSPDGGLTFDKVEYPASLDSNRVMIRYGEEGGKSKDGLIELRRGVDDISMGKSNYAQVRILVDGTHYLKGMAIYTDGDGMPPGVDVIFNTNKESGIPKMKVLKEIKNDPDNPFGAYFAADGQTHYGENNEKLSVVNKLKMEGDWNEQSKNLSQQFLSKQPQQLIERQLNVTYGDYESKYDEIMSLDNSTLRKKMLLDFAGECDSAAISLKASALPRQRTQVIIPVDGMKEDEIYAPNYKDGEEVVLIRYPHAGTFEIPRLKVNNKNADGIKTLGPNASDAVGINSKVAEQLSGADFDGDTVVVIPTANGVRIKTKEPLKGLVGFDPKEQYPYVPGMKVMSEKYKQRQMGEVSNLITDMTLGGAPEDEIVRAVKHSMVVIDAAKHKLNYKQSEIDNDIAGLKAKWQTRVDDEGNVKTGGASTLLSRRKQTILVPETKGAPIIDKETGKVTYKESGRKYYDKKGNLVTATQKASLLLSVDDALELSSGTPQEKAYAEFANKMKALGDTARKEYKNTPPAEYKPSARLTYAPEVESILSKLDVAESNAPRERRAQAIANGVMKAKIATDPSLADKDNKKQYNKIKNMALNDARASVGASGRETRIRLTDKEWEAIQAGALSDSRTQSVFRYCDQDELVSRALPRTSTAISSAKQAKIANMRIQGYTNAQIAESVGVSVSTVTKYIKEQG